MGAPKAGDVVTIVTLVVGAGSAPPVALRQQQRAEESTTAAWREDRASERGGVERMGACIAQRNNARRRS